MHESPITHCVCVCARARLTVFLWKRLNSICGVDESEGSVCCWSCCCCCVRPWVHTRARAHTHTKRKNLLSISLIGRWLEAPVVYWLVCPLSHSLPFIFSCTLTLPLFNFSPYFQYVCLFGFFFLRVKSKSNLSSSNNRAIISSVHYIPAEHEPSEWD